MHRLKIPDMIDKRTLEFILTDQQEELESRADETLCNRMEEKEIDLKSPQAQFVIGVRRSGKSTLCYQALQRNDLKYAYVDFDDERLATLESYVQDIARLFQDKILTQIPHSFNIPNHRTSCQ